jgi:hypothetical protein
VVKRSEFGSRSKLGNLKRCFNWHDILGYRLHSNLDKREGKYTCRVPVYKMLPSHVLPLKRVRKARKALVFSRLRLSHLSKLGCKLLRGSSVEKLVAYKQGMQDPYLLLKEPVFSE